MLRIVKKAPGTISFVFRPSRKEEKSVSKNDTKRQLRVNKVTIIVKNYWEAIAPQSQFPNPESAASLLTEKISFMRCDGPNQST